jgi:hypothetical protein
MYNPGDIIADDVLDKELKESFGFTIPPSSQCVNAVTKNTVLGKLTEKEIFAKIERRQPTLMKEISEKAQQAKREKAKAKRKAERQLLTGKKKRDLKGKAKAQNTPEEDAILKEFDTDTEKSESASEEEASNKSPSSTSSSEKGKCLLYVCCIVMKC